MYQYSRLVILILSLTILGGCSAKYIKGPQLSLALQDSKVEDHFLFIDNNGIMRDVDNRSVFDYESKVNKMLATYDAMRLHHPKLELTIYIHGGLNTFSETKRRVENTYKRILGDKDKPSFPIFISWKSGPFTNYFDHLFAIRNGERNVLKGVLSSPFVFSEDILRSAARIPASYWNILAGQNQIAINIVSDIEDASNTSESELERNSEFKLYKDTDASRGHDFWDFASIWNPAKFVSAPLIDGFGKGAWRSMLRRTDLVLNSQQAFNGNGEVGSETAAYYLLEKLSTEYSSINKTLIGHSMGSIIANNILTKFPDLKLDNIVYMAAACSLKSIRSSVVPWLKKNKNSKFYNLTLNPYRDINENFFYDFTPRGSLLIWIDDFLEEVNSFEDRTAGYWFNTMRSAEVIFPKDVRSRVALTRFGIRDKTPQNHGEFDDYNFWSKQFWRNNKKEIYKIVDQ